MVEANKIIQRDRKGNWKVKGLEWEQLRTGEIVAMMELVGVGIPQPVADHADHIVKDFK